MLTKLELPAIMMCSKRIAALAGDARKALDVLRRALPARVQAENCGGAESVGFLNFGC